MSADHLPAAPMLDDAVAGLPVTAAQSEILVAQQLDPQSTVYNLSLVVEATRPIDIERATEAIRRTVEHAEAMHCGFRLGETGRSARCRHRNDAWPFEVVDVRDAVDPEAAAQDWMDRDIATVVDITGDDALFGHALIRLADDHTLWYQRYHHSIIDGFGISLIVADMVTRYDDPDLASTAGAWALQDLIDADIDYRASARFESDRDYWLAEILDAPEPPQHLRGRAPTRPPPPNPRRSRSTARSPTRCTGSRPRRVSAPHRLPMALILAYLHRISGLRALTRLGPHGSSRRRAMRRTHGHGRRRSCR